jgi:hypothetical protein
VTHTRALVIFIVAIAAVSSARAQWPEYPTPNDPRLPSGEIETDAPAPRTADGHPVL